MAGVTNNGVVGYISNPVASFPKNSITVDIFGNTFYRDYEFGAGDDTGVYWNDKQNYSKEVMMFLATAMQLSTAGKFSYGKKLRSSKSLDLKILLPTKNNAIDFDFMEEFIAEIEAERVAEIEAYLTAAGFKDTELTAEEAAALNKDDVEWREYRLGDLFEIKSYKKRFDANKTTLVEGTGHPYIVRQGHSNGQKGYIDEDIKFLNEGNTISFGQDTATAFYQEKPYFTGDKIKILKLKSDKFSKLNALFFITAVNKAFSDFSWGASSYNIDTIKSQKLLLPTKNNSIDFDFMEHFIRAIEKEIIRGVVEFGEKKSAAYREVVRS